MTTIILSPMLFTGLSFVLFILVIYSFLDNKNRIYGCIISSFCSFLLAAFLAIEIVSGNVKDSFYKVSSVTTNETTNISTYTYGNYTVVYQSSPLMWLFVIISVVMLIFTFLYIIEVVSEKGEEE